MDLAEGTDVRRTPGQLHECPHCSRDDLRSCVRSSEQTLTVQFREKNRNTSGKGTIAGRGPHVACAGERQIDAVSVGVHRIACIQKDDRPGSCFSANAPYPFDGFGQRELHP